MNPLPPNADELVSAYLDGEATSDEIAIVESSPELMSRVQTMRALSLQLGAPVSAPAEQKEAHIAAALGAFDEMFSVETDRAATEPVTSPTLVAVPEPARGESHGFDSSSGVTSLAAARARRRPRGFNTGVIAAAAAAVLLFVAVAALSFGRGNDSADVATSSIDIAVAADDASDTSSDSAAMVEEAPVEDERTEETSDGDSAAGSALNAQAEPEAAAPAEAPAAIQSADEEEAMDEESMEDLVEAEVGMADDSMAEDSVGEADGDTVEDSAEVTPFIDEFFLGAFPDEETLRLELGKVTSDNFDARSSFFEPGLFPGCQADVAELARLDTPTFVGEAILDGEPVEIHLVSTNDEGISLIIVDASDCLILSTVP